MALIPQDATRVFLHIPQKGIVQKNKAQEKIGLLK
jgi:hypothetical protein